MYYQLQHILYYEVFIGGDFVLENKNRRIKMWAPPGLPTKKQWQSVCRNLDDLEEVKQLTALAWNTLDTLHCQHHNTIYFFC